MKPRMTRTRVLIAVVVAALLLVASAGATNSSDKVFARKLVATQGDIRITMFNTGGGMRPERCLPRHGFAITARATAPHWGTPYDGYVDSVAAVLKTHEDARAYYAAVAKTISACLARQLGEKYGSEVSVRSERALAFPHFGDESIAERQPLDFTHSGPAPHKYTFDWVLLRKHRAVLVDDFLSPVGSSARFAPDWAKREPRIVDRELARAFGS
jgi:hypothetical protein